MGKERWEGFDNLAEDISRIGVFLVTPAGAIRLQDAKPAGNR